MALHQQQQLKPDRISSSRQSSEKEAKALSAELAALLSRKDPWNQDVVFARENLRRHCLALVFRPTKQSDSAATGNSHARKRLSGLNRLFLCTSHNVIHHYRQRLAVMDKAIAHAPSSSTASANKQQQLHRGSGAGGDRRGNDSPSATTKPNQRRRLLYEFREFLEIEESFWRDLLIRIVAVFDVKEAQASLRILQLGASDWDADLSLSGSVEIREQAILLVHKALICYGDLARYCELYAHLSKPKSQLQQTLKPRGGKSAPRLDGTDRSKIDKDWSRAYEAYYQARLLIPDDGNASNQLAVLASYQQDSVSSVYHYYRALCTRKPFLGARENLAATLTKILAQFEADERRRQDRRKLQISNGSYARLDEDDEQGSNHRRDKRHAFRDRPKENKQSDSATQGEDFHQNFVALHAMLFRRTSVASLPAQFTAVAEDFAACVAKRILPSDVIVKVLVTALSAWWYTRVYRHQSSSSDKEEPTSEKERLSTFEHASLESSALMHALAIIAELCTIGTRESRQVEPYEGLRPSLTASEAGKPMLLAQSLSAVFRRTLPALRIASMWLQSNADYLSKFDTTSAIFKTDNSTVAPELCTAIRGFWQTYASFANAVRQAFPLPLLPTLAGDLSLEEDVDMLGFAPLKRRPQAGTPAESKATGDIASTDLHPNEEQMLRISDLLGNADLLARSDSCPVDMDNGVFVIRKKRLNPTSQPWNPSKATDPLIAFSVSPSVREDALEDDDDDDIYKAYDDHIVIGDTEEILDEDVLDLAMRVATGGQGEGGFHLGNDEDEEQEGEQNLYGSQLAHPPVTRSQATNTPSPPTQPRLQSVAPATVQNTRTASDLLLQVLQGNALDIQGPTTVSGSTSAFGGQPPFGGSHSSSAFGDRSIWSSGMISVAPIGLERQRSQSGSGLNGSAAEALFNSMPNYSQNQNQNHSQLPIGGQRFGSPAVGAVGSGVMQPDIWNGHSPKRTPAAAQSAFPTGITFPQHQHSRKHG